MISTKVVRKNNELYAFEFWKPIENVGEYAEEYSLFCLLVKVLYLYKSMKIMHKYSNAQIN